jgi:GNAT superfamily N-acetyltransferase
MVNKRTTGADAGPGVLELQIRPVDPEEASLVATVLYKSFAEYESFYTPEGFSATTPNADHILHRMSEGPVWAAYRGAEMLGTVAAVIKGESLYMRGMAVAPSARGLGVGTRLLFQVEKWARQQGCVRMFLNTTPFLSAAIRLYEGSGFRRTGEGPHDLFGTPLFSMEKVVSTPIEIR